MSIIYSDTESKAAVYNTTDELNIFSNSFSFSGTLRPIRFTVFGAGINDSAGDSNLFFRFYIKSVDTVGLNAEIPAGGGARFKTVFTLVPAGFDSYVVNAELFTGASGSSSPNAGSCEFSYGAGSEDINSSYLIEITAQMEIADSQVGLTRYLVLVEYL